MSDPDDGTLRVRIPRVNLLAVAVTAVCTIPLAAASPWLAAVWLLPVLGGVWVVRAGVDADRTGLTVHELFRTRRLAWDDIAGLRIRRSRVAAVRRDGRAVRLPVLRPRHLSVLASVSGGRLPDPTEPAPAQ